MSGKQDTKLPQSLEHLDLSKFSLLRDVLGLLAEPGNRDDDPDKGGMFFGAVYEGAPNNPSQPTSVAYALGCLPSPELGSIPRDEIFEELNNDANKEVKQRRDFSFPDAVAATCPIYIMYFFLFTFTFPALK